MGQIFSGVCTTSIGIGIITVLMIPQCLFGMTTEDGKPLNMQENSSIAHADREMGEQKVDTLHLTDAPLSLTKAIRIAIANNPDQKIAWARIQQAEAALKLTDAAFLPYLGFYTEFIKSNAPSVNLFKSIDQRLFDPAADFNQPGTIRNFETGLNTQLNLYNGGKDSLAKEIAGAELEMSKMSMLAVENELAAAVITTYFTWMTAEDFIKIAEESVTTVKEQLRIMKVKFAQGDALKSDILTLQVRLAQAKENSVRGNGRLAAAKAAFATVLGYSPEHIVTLAEETTLIPDPPESYEKVVALALKKRPELLKLRHQIELAGKSLDMAEAGYLPELVANGKLYYDDPDMNYSGDRNNWLVAVMMNWDIFTGFSTSSQKRKAAAMIQEVLAANRKLILAIKLEVKNAIIKFEEANARLTVAQSRTEMSRESLSLVTKQYEGGSVTITRYLEAELDYNASKISETAAFYDKKKALAEIFRATGTLTEELNIPDE